MQQLVYNMYKDEVLKEYIREVNSFLNKAYVPYSKFQVAALLIDENNNKYIGVNVENASYGLTICAERNVITTAVTNGMKKIKLIVITGNTEEPISPCGMCRQFIREFSNEKTLIVLASSKTDDIIKMSVKELLPYSFGPEHL